MIFVNGRVEHKPSDDVIDEIQASIYTTLKKPWLDSECVIAALEGLLLRIVNGDFNKELRQFIQTEKSFDTEVEKLRYILENNKISDKYNIELAQWKEEIESTGRRKVVPIGVLLHIAAGNMDVLPIFSVIEGLLAGNINILKLPKADQGLTVYLAQKLIDLEPSLAEYIYIFDTPSYDIDTIEKLMNLANGVAIWGGEEAVKALREKAPVNVKIIEWGHKLSFCYIADLAIPDSVLKQLAYHLLRSNQLLCSSYQVIYLNTRDYNVVKGFGMRFAKILEETEGDFPIEKAIQGKETIELYTKELEQMVLPSKEEVVYRNRRTSVICKRDSMLELSLLYGNVLVKPLPKEKIIETLYSNRGYLQTVGVYPKNEHTINLFLRVGVTHIQGLKDASVYEQEGAHDGVFPLQQYSRIVEIGGEDEF